MDNKNTDLKPSSNGVKVHPNAFVDSKAELHDGVIISQGAIVGPDVTIGRGTEIGPNAVITGRTQLGINNKVFPNVFIGLDPQDLKYKGASTEVIIGDNNTFRECVTINKATNEGEKTIIGNNNLLMAYSHLGHNCELGDGIVMSNSVQVAGHVKVEDKAIIGGCLGIHQFVHIGYLANDLKTASDEAGEELWQMPLQKSYKDGLKSHIADMKNTGPRAGGSITAALFLEEFFNEDIKWAHIDIAGTCWTDKNKGINPSGATGFGVRTLVQWIKNK